MQSIDRAVAILELVSKVDQGLPVTEVGRMMEMPVATAHRFLKSLAANGLVTQDPKTKFFKLGIKIVGLASCLLNSNRLIEVARAPMRAAAEKLDHVVYLSQRSQTSAICVSSEDPNAGGHTKFAAQIGLEMPFYAAAAAKMLFAFDSEPALRGLIALQTPLKAFTPKTKITVDDILEDAKQTRINGYAVCDEELESGVIAVAAPVYSYDGSIIASVAVTGIKSNVNTEQVISDITECGRIISKAMGFSG